MDEMVYPDGGGAAAGETSILRHGRENKNQQKKNKNNKNIANC